MSTSPSNSDNFNQYQDNIQRYNRGNLKPTTIDYDNIPLPFLISKLCAEGEEILRQEELEKAKKAPKTPPPVPAPKTEKKRLERTLGVNDNNPYVRARNQILSKMKENDRKMIERMEEEDDTNNRTYENFTHQVAELGDTL
jgi:hypothetical protein